jgi:hypothetical protein
VTEHIALISEGLRAKAASIEFLKCVYGSFVIDQVPRSLKALLTIAALECCSSNVDILNVLFKGVLIGRNFPTKVASILHRFRVMILPVSLISLHIAQIVAANFTFDAIFGSLEMNLSMLLDSVLSLEGF